LLNFKVKVFYRRFWYLIGYLGVQYMNIFSKTNNKMLIFLTNFIQVRTKPAFRSLSYSA